MDWISDYWAHRAMHYGPLYKKIHKLHHEFSAPFGLAAEYAHPIEILVLGMGTVGGPLLWCWLSGGNCHIITMVSCYTCIVSSRNSIANSSRLVSYLVPVDYSTPLSGCRCSFWIRLPLVSQQLPTILGWG